MSGATPRIGLALGGGAARGLAHIPMLEVFDEMGLKPSIIAGSSFGALVGAAYASGIPAKEIGDHARQILANRMQAAKYLFGVKGARLSDLLKRRSFTSLLIDGEQLTSFILPDGVAKRVDELEPPDVATPPFDDPDKQRTVPRAEVVSAVLAHRRATLGEPTT